MALATITSPSISAENVESSFRIDKYDFENYDLLKSKLDDIFEKSNAIVQPSITRNERDIIISLSGDDTINLRTITGDFELLTNRHNFENGEPDDDPNRRNIGELQRNILKSIKIKNYADIEQKKQRINQQRVIRLYSFIEKNKLAYEKSQKEKSMFSFLFKIVSLNGIIAITTAVGATSAVIIFNSMLVNPMNVTWFIDNGIKLLESDFIFNIWLDIMTNAGIFTFTEKLNIRKLRNDMLRDFDSNIHDKKNTIFINDTIQASFEKMPTADYNSRYPEVKQQTGQNTVYIFYNYIHSAIKNKDISDLDIFNKNNSNYVDYITSLYNSNLGRALLSYLRIAAPIVGYVTTSYEILEKYEKINSVIFLKGLFNPLLQGESSRYYYQMVSAPIVDKASDLIQFVLQNNVPGIGLYFTQDWKNFYTGKLQTVLNIKINNDFSTYFDRIEKEMKKKPTIENNESVLSIEEEIIKRAKYKSEGLTNEEIAELLSPIPPSASDYKSFIGRYMEKFYNKFKSFLKNPVLYLNSLSTVVGLWNSLQVLLFPAILTQVNILLQKFILDGYANYNLFNLINLDYEWLKINIVDILTDFFQLLFGSDEVIIFQLKQFKYQLSNEIIYDIHVLLRKLGNIILNINFGNNYKLGINKYVKNITDIILNDLFVSVCNIAYQIFVMPEMAKVLEPYIPLNWDKNILETVRDEKKLTRFAAFLNHKTSNSISNIYNGNIFTGTKNVIRELAQLGDINNVLFENVIPYLDSQKYFDVKNLNVDKLQGSIVDIYDSNDPTKKVEYIVIERETTIKPGNNENIFKLYDTNDLLDILIDNANSQITDPTKQGKSILYNKSKTTTKINEIFYSYYYTKFMKDQYAKKGSSYVFKSEDFKKYLFDIYYNLDIKDNKTDEEKIEYGIIHGVLNVYNSKHSQLLGFLIEMGSIPVKFVIDILKVVLPKNITSGINWTVQTVKDYIKYIDYFGWIQSAYRHVFKSKTATQIIDYKPEYKSTDKRDGTIEDEDFMLIDNLLGNIDASKIKEKNQDEIIEKGVLNFVIPHTFGYSLDAVPLQSFMDIRQILDSININDQFKDPIDILDELKQKDNNNLKHDLIELNRKYVRQSLKIQKKIKKVMEGFVNSFTDKKKNINLRYLNFDYNIFKKIITDKVSFLTPREKSMMKKLNPKYFTNIPIKKKCTDNGITKYVLAEEEKEYENTCKKLENIDASDYENIFARPDVIIQLYKSRSNSPFTKEFKKMIEKIYLDLPNLVVESLTKQIKELDTNKKQKELQVKTASDEKSKDQLNKELLQLESEHEILSNFKNILENINEYVKLNPQSSVEVQKIMYDYLDNIIDYSFYNTENIIERIKEYETICNDSTLSDKEKNEKITEEINEDNFLDRIYFEETQSQQLRLNQEYGITVSNLNSIVKKQLYSGKYKDLLKTKLVYFNDFITKMNEKKTTIVSKDPNTFSFKCPPSSSSIITTPLTIPTQLTSPISDEDIFIDYYNHLPEWYLLQKELYILYMKMISNTLYKKITRNMDNYKKDIESLSQNFLLDLTKIKNKYENTNQNQFINFQQTLFQSSASSGPAAQSQATPGPRGQVSQGPALTPEPPSQTQVERQQMEVEQKIKEELQIKEETELTETLGEDEAVDEKTEEKLALDLGFSGAADFFSNMVNMLSNTFNTPIPLSTIPEMNTDVEDINPDNQSQTPLEICKSLFKKWYMAATKLILVDNSADRRQCNNCKKPNLIYTMAYKLAEVIKILKSYLAAGKNVTGAVGAANIVYSIFTKGVWLIKLLITIVVTCGPKWFLYLYVKTLQNIKVQLLSSSLRDSLGIRILYMNFVYLMSVFVGDSSTSIGGSIFDKMMNAATLVLDAVERKLTESICSMAVQVPGGIDILISDEVIIIKNKLNKDEQGNDKYPRMGDASERNILGFIDRGQVEKNGINESDLTNLLGLLATIPRNDNNLNLLYTTTGENCDDYNLPGYNNLDITDVFYATIEDLSNQQRPFIINYMFCQVIGAIPKKSDYNEGWLTLIDTITRRWGYYWGAFLNGGYTNLINMLVDLLSLVSMDTNAKNCLLTYLYGSRSYGENINLGREYIQDELDKIIKDSTNQNGVIDKAKLQTELRNQLSIVGTFTWNWLYTIYDEVTSLASRHHSSKGEILELEAYKDYKDYLTDKEQKGEELEYDSIKDYIENANTYLREKIKVKGMGVGMGMGRSSSNSDIPNFNTVNIDNKQQLLDYEKKIDSFLQKLYSDKLTKLNIILIDPSDPSKFSNDPKAKQQIIIYLNEVKDMIKSGYNILNGNTQNQDDTDIKNKFLDKIKNGEILNPVMKFGLTQFNINSHLNSNKELDKKTIIITECNGINEYVIGYINDQETFNSKCIKIPTPSEESDFKIKNLNFKSDLERYKDDKNLSLGKITNIVELINTYLNVKNSQIFDGRPQDAASVFSAIFTLINFSEIKDEDEDKDEIYKNILKSLKSEFEKILNMEITPENQQFIRKIIQEINPENPEIVKNFKKQYINYITGKNDLEYEKFNDSNILKEFIENKISKLNESQPDYDAILIFYFIKFIMEKNLNYEEILKKMYFTENIDKIGIEKIDNKIKSDPDFKRKLLTQIGFLLTEKANIYKQLFRVSENLKIKNEIDVTIVPPPIIDVTKPSDILLNNKDLNDRLNIDVIIGQSLYGPSITAYDFMKNKLIENLNSINGLYLTRQKDPIERKTITLLTNKKENTYSETFLSYIQPDDIGLTKDANILELYPDSYLDEITINGINDNDLLIPPILYDVEIDDRSQILIELNALKKQLQEYKEIHDSNTQDQEIIKASEKAHTKYINYLAKLAILDNYYLYTDPSTKKKIRILKQDIALYKSTYIDFNQDEYCKKLLDHITDRNKIVETKLNDPQNKTYFGAFVDGISYVFSSFWSDHSLTIAKFRDYYNGLFGYKFNYFDTLELSGDLKIWDETLFRSTNELKPIKKITDIPEKIDYLIPISILYKNIFNRFLDKSGEQYTIKYDYKNIKTIANSGNSP
jgi:hypothetical protein